MLESHLLVASLLVFMLLLAFTLFLLASHAIPASIQLLFLLASVALLASHLCEYTMLLLASRLFLASPLLQTSKQSMVLLASVVLLASLSYMLLVATGLLLASLASKQKFQSKLKRIEGNLANILRCASMKTTLISSK